MKHTQVQTLNLGNEIFHIVHLKLANEVSSDLLRMLHHHQSITGINFKNLSKKKTEITQKIKAQTSQPWPSNPKYVKLTHNDRCWRDSK